jgi:hypothetical protein
MLFHSWMRMTEAKKEQNLQAASDFLDQL